MHRLSYVVKGMTPQVSTSIVWSMANAEMVIHITQEFVIKFYKGSPYHFNYAHGIYHDFKWLQSLTKKRPGIL